MPCSPVIEPPQAMTWEIADGLTCWVDLLLAHGFRTAKLAAVDHAGKQLQLINNALDYENAPV
jgi:hypothetical protein